MLLNILGKYLGAAVKYSQYLTNWVIWTNKKSYSYIIIILDGH